MAYNNSLNPDALIIRHAEPEQAAQLLATQGRRSRSPQSNSSIAPPPSSTRPSYQNKPQPPLPTIQPLSYKRNSISSAAGPLSPHTPSAPLRPFSPGSNQGHVPPPLQPGRGRPGSAPKAMNPSLFPLFKAVDKTGMGQLSEDELSTALVNGDYTSFDPVTVRMMIRMFDNDRSGTVGFEEFCNLWSFLAAWRNLFERFDEDHSGYISYDEYSRALVAFGYNLTPQFVTMVYRMHEKRGTDMMSFDLFVQSCISLKRLTDIFKAYDTDRDGFITLSFEEFLTEILLQR